MSANVATKISFPVRGTPGGWRDPWDEPIDYAALRAEVEAAEHELERFADREGPAWREEIAEERRRTPDLVRAG